MIAIDSGNIATSTKTGSFTTHTFNAPLVRKQNGIFIVSHMAYRTVDVSIPGTTSITFNGVSMTRAVEQGRGLTGPKGYVTSIYYMLAKDMPADGTHSVVITYSETINQAAAAVAYQLYGCKQRGPVLTGASNPSGSVTSIDTTLNVGATDLGAWIIANLFGLSNQDVTVAYGDTERYDTSPGAGSKLTNYTRDGVTSTGNNTVGATFASRSDNLQVCAVFTPDRAGYQGGLV